MHDLLKKNLLKYIADGKAIIFRADIHLIGGCNFKCIMCDNWKNEIEMHFKYEDLIKYILILKKEYNCNYIRFHGQEPTMYNKLEDLVFFSKKLGLKVAIKTNAWLLSDNRLVKILKYSLDELYLSIDGPNKEIHDEIRGVKGSFEKNIDVIIKSKKINPNIKIYINSVVMKSNYKYLIKMIELGHKYKIDRVSFVFLNDKNRKDINEINLDKEEFINFFKKDVLEIYKKSDLYKISVDFSPFISNFVGKSTSYIISELENNFTYYEDEILNFYNGDYGRIFYDKFGCSGPLDHCSINFNGDMFGCCVVERDRNNAIGNILNEDLSGLWNSEKYKNYRQNSNSICSYAKKCASNFYTRKKLFKSIYLDDKIYLKNNPLNYYRYLKELNNETQSILNKIKLNKFKNILLYFNDNLPFYKNLLLNNNINREDLVNVQSLEFISRLPILNKKILKENIIEINNLSNGKEYLEGKTSGNSGDRLEFRYTLSFNRYIKQIVGFSLAGDFTYNDGYFSVTPINCNQTIINNLQEPDYVNKVYISISNFSYNKDIFIGIKNIFEKNKNIKFIHGDSKYILFFILGFKKYNLELPNINLISLSYSYTNKSLKKFIEQSFNCKVLDNYGCSEVGPISYDDNGKKKLYGDNIILEEQNKELIVTDLDNIFFPFIRYKNGDLGEINNNIINLYGKKIQQINGLNLIDLDNYFFENFPDILFYQFEGSKLYVILLENNINNKEIKIAENSISLFLGKEIKISILDNEFFRVGECSKFKTLI